MVLVSKGEGSNKSAKPRTRGLNRVSSNLTQSDDTLFPERNNKIQGEDGGDAKGEDDVVQ